MQKLGASSWNFHWILAQKAFPLIFLTHQPPFMTHGTSGKGLQLSVSQCSHLWFGSMMTNFNEMMHYCLLVFSPHHQEILHISWVSYNWTQFWHYLPRDSVGSHWLRVQPLQGCYPHQMPIASLGFHLHLTNQLHFGCFHDVFLGLINLPELVTELRERSYSITCLL